jgi:glucose/arabinose dehydrogenase
MHFGPEAVHLYFATGDGGSGDDPPNNAQTGTVLLGKMLRIIVNTSSTPPFYTVPTDNPFVNDPNVLDEIWALGLRNPFRWSFDKMTNDIWIGDVGQDQVEEIDFRAAGTTAGANYGWRCYEGTSKCDRRMPSTNPVIFLPYMNIRIQGEPAVLLLL